MFLDGCPSTAGICHQESFFEFFLLDLKTPLDFACLRHLCDFVFSVRFGSGRLYMTNGKLGVQDLSNALEFRPLMSDVGSGQRWQCGAVRKGEYDVFVKAFAGNHVLPPNLERCVAQEARRVAEYDAALVATCDLNGQERWVGTKKNPRNRHTSLKFSFGFIVWYFLSKRKRAFYNFLSRRPS